MRDFVHKKQRIFALNLQIKEFPLSNYLMAAPMCYGSENIHVKKG